MSNHTTAIVPIEVWGYQSPDLIAKGRTIDIGLFAESLLYYDKIYLNIGNENQFAELLSWFIKNSKLSTLLQLFDEDIVSIFEYAFITSAIDVERSGTYEIMNIQSELQSQPNTFNRRILYSPKVDAVLTKSKQRIKLYKALDGKIIEAKADDYGSPIENARKDYLNPQRNSLILQAFLDELYALRNLGKPPEISTQVSKSPDGTKNIINWNVDLDKISAIAGKDIGFHKGSPLTAGALSNRLLWSASKMSSDLFLSRPMSTLVGDKLYEVTATSDKINRVVENLKLSVEFPDIRQLINEGIMPFSELLEIRKKAKRFREWIQQESERDRDAIIAYHHEVAKESGLKVVARTSLTLFGILGGSIIGNQVAGMQGQMVGGVLGSSVSYLTDLASKLNTDWRPVVFGNWLQERISKLVHK